MTEFSRVAGLSDEKRPLSKLVSLIIFVLGGYMVANVFALFAVVLLLGIGRVEMASLIQNPTANKNAWSAVMLLQALVSFGSFVLTPILYLTWVEKRPLSDLNPNKYLSWMALLLVVVLVIAFIPFNDLIIQWNNSLDLPKFLEPVEQWMREKEDSLREMTQLLTGFRGLSQLALGLLVIAIIPAVGEELLFRGLLQNKLLAVTRNVHVAIWLAALVFSAIHLQFLGFFPRMLLGALFGYLYIWSGNLWVSILAHFVNNGFTLVMMNLYQQKMSDYNAESDQTIPWPLALLSLALVLSILFYLKNYWRAHSRQLVSDSSGNHEPMSSPHNE